MKNRATNIFQRFVVSVLLVGLTAHLLVPFFGNAQKTAFTQWLDYNVVASGDESELELRSTIRNLPENTDNFWMLVQEASELISNHKDEFRISPFAASEQNDHVTSWLIDQWSLFKHHKTGSNAILPEILNPLQKWISQSTLTTEQFFTDQRTVLQQFSEIGFLYSSDLIDRSLSPLVNGISINAP